SQRLPDDAIVCADSGSSTNWFARDLRLKPNNRASLSGTLATMGPGVPYAIAAKFAHPGRPVIAFVGDGAYQMNGMNELITVKRYWERWSDPTLVFCVFNNQDLNQVTWEQRVLAGDPKYPGTQWLPNFPYAKYAELVGFEGHAGDATGLGYTYAPAAAGALVEEKLAEVVRGVDVHAIGAAWSKMAAELRNAGRPGIGFCALAAVDVALWDLKARLLELPLVDLLPRAHNAVPIYGSGGFCSYSLDRLAEQLSGWAEAGIPRVKMKVGREPERDSARLDAARRAT